MNHLRRQEKIHKTVRLATTKTSYLRQRGKLSYVNGRGYFSGQGTGLVTVAGKPAKREIWLLSLKNNKFVSSTWSDHDGTYFIRNLDPEQEYLIICRDYERERAPFAWDYRLPATEMTLREQLDLLKERGFEIYDHDNPS